MLAMSCEPPPLIFCGPHCQIFLEVIFALLRERGRAENGLLDDPGKSVPAHALSPGIQ